MKRKILVGLLYFLINLLIILAVNANIEISFVNPIKDVYSRGDYVDLSYKIQNSLPENKIVLVGEMLHQPFLAPTPLIGGINLAPNIPVTVENGFIADYADEGDYRLEVRVYDEDGNKYSLEKEFKVIDSLKNIEIEELRLCDLLDCTYELTAFNLEQHRLVYLYFAFSDRPDVEARLIKPDEATETLAISKKKGKEYIQIPLTQTGDYYVILYASKEGYIPQEIPVGFVVMAKPPVIIDLRDNKGDSDNDGIPDNEDKCPDSTGIIVADGCTAADILAAGPDSPLVKELNQKYPGIYGQLTAQQAGAQGKGITGKAILDVLKNTNAVPFILLAISLIALIWVYREMR